MANNVNAVGISDMRPFLPAWCYSLSQWAERMPPDRQPVLLRAIRATGQKSMRLPRPYEDTVTMASNAILRLLSQPHNRQRIQHIRYLAAGTETGVDNSKALSAYILEALAESDCALPSCLSNFQVQHACAGGTIALFSLCALLQISGQDTDSALVVCTDVAHYRQNESAEITQGAGAVGLLLTRSPRLLALDVSVFGHASRGTDDFFRPLGSLGANVRGNYSVRCYCDAFKVAVSDLAERRGMDVQGVLDECDYVVLHTPFKAMARHALHNLLATSTDYTTRQIAEYIEERKVTDAVEAVTLIGNTYSASVYFVLYALLAQQYKSIGADIVNKKVLICSYGSGYTMTVMMGVVAPDAPRVIAMWEAEKLFSQYIPMSDEEYERWKEVPYAIRNDDLAASPSYTVGSGEVYLRSIREDGYREYSMQS